MNQQGLLWNVYYVATLVVRKQINFQSEFIRSERSSCDVYSPKAVKMLTYFKFYEYSTLNLVQNILPFCVIETLDSKRVLNT